MSDTIKGAIIGALITVAGSVLIFYLGQFSTEETLEKNTVKILSEYFDYVNSDMEYKEALQALYTQSLEQQNENEKLQNQIKELNKEKQELSNTVNNTQEELQRTENNEHIVNSAKQYAENGEIKNALLLLLGVKTPTPEMAILIDDYQRDFETQIILQATLLSGENKYEEAIEVVEEALMIIPNNSLLKEKRDEINQLKPQKLISISPPYEKYGYTEMISSPMSMGGENYYYGFQLGKAWDVSYANFNLGAKYNTVSVVIGHIDGSGEVDKTVNIYADDVLIDTVEVKNQNLPKEYTYNVKGVRRLAFERSSGDTQTGFGEITVQ